MPHVDDNKLFQSAQGSVFRRAVLLSLFLHLLLLVFQVPSPATASLPVEVTLLQPDNPADRIVSPPVNKSQTPPKDAKQKSDYNAITEREQIQRGLPDSGPGPAVPSKVVAKQESKPESAEKAKQAPLKSESKQRPQTPPKLTLNQSDLAQTLASVARTEERAMEQKQSTAENAAAERERLKSELQLSQQQPFSSSSFSSLFRGKSGSADYLPKLPDGDITLLNAKADQYAVFVRRVASQVFGAIRKRNWQELSYSEMQSISHFVTVEAVMGPDGRMKSVRQLDSSGSIKFDEILRHSANEGAWDQNPPKGAESDDGNIHFIFKSRTWARRVGDARFEQRWLLLGTGLL